MSFLLSLLLLGVPETKVDTSWMRLDAFHLAIGMSRTQVMSTLSAWQPKHGKNANEMTVDYSDDKSLTLEFRDERLRAVRFELFVMIADVRKAFDAERARLHKERGEPRKATKSILIYDNALPNLMVVVTDDPSSQQGKKGLGVLAARYYDPR